jgi:hypothetical protein
MRKIADGWRRAIYLTDSVCVGGQLFRVTPKNDFLEAVQNKNRPWRTSENHLRKIVLLPTIAGRRIGSTPLAYDREPPKMDGSVVASLYKFSYIIVY